MPRRSRTRRCDPRLTTLAPARPPRTLGGPTAARDHSGVSAPWGERCAEGSGAGDGPDERPGAASPATEPLPGKGRPPAHRAGGRSVSSREPVRRPKAPRSAPCSRGRNRSGSRAPERTGSRAPERTGSSMLPASCTPRGPRSSRAQAEVVSSWGCSSGGISRRERPVVGADLGPPLTIRTARQRPYPRIGCRALHASRTCPGPRSVRGVNASWKRETSVQWSAHAGACAWQRRDHILPESTPHHHTGAASTQPLR